MATALVDYKDNMTEEILKLFDSPNQYQHRNRISEEICVILWIWCVSWMLIAAMATRNQLELRRNLRIFPRELIVLCRAFEQRRRNGFGIGLSNVVKSLQLKVDKIKIQNPRQNQQGDLENGGTGIATGIGQSKSKAKAEPKSNGGKLCSPKMIRRCDFALYYSLWVQIGILVAYIFWFVVDFFMDFDTELKPLDISWYFYSRLDIDWVFFFWCCLISLWTACICTLYYQNQFKLHEILQHKYPNPNPNGNQNRAYKKSISESNEESTMEKTTEINFDSFQVTPVV